MVSSPVPIGAVATARVGPLPVVVEPTPRASVPALTIVPPLKVFALPRVNLPLPPYVKMEARHCCRRPPRSLIVKACVALPPG